MQPQPVLTIHGRVQPSDQFPSKIRNQQPLLLRQIVSESVLQQWALNPAHVVAALSSNVSSATSSTATATTTTLNPANAVLDLRHHDQGRHQSTTTTTPSITPTTTTETTQEEQDHSSTLVTPQQVLPVMVAKDQQNYLDNPQFTETIHLPIDGLVNKVLQVNNPILSSSSAAVAIPDQFYYRGHVPATLAADLDISGLCKSLSLPTVNTRQENAPKPDLMRIWVSLAGATTPLHYDRCHGILVQLVGRKRFVVFSHEDTRSVYPSTLHGPSHISKTRGLTKAFPGPPPLVTKSSPSSSTASSLSSSPRLLNRTIPSSTSSLSSSPISSNACWDSMTITTTTTTASDDDDNTYHHPKIIKSVKELDQDEITKSNMAEVLERWPKLDGTQPWVIDLEPGDALYTPVGFWHEVWSVDNSISVTIPWDMSLSEIDDVPSHMAF